MSGQEKHHLPDEKSSGIFIVEILQGARMMVSIAWVLVFLGLLIFFDRQLLSEATRWSSEWNFSRHILLGMGGAILTGSVWEYRSKKSFQKMPIELALFFLFASGCVLGLAVEFYEYIFEAPGLLSVFSASELFLYDDTILDLRADWVGATLGAFLWLLVRRSHCCQT